MKKEITCQFTSTLFYEIAITAKYMKLIGGKFLEKNNLNLTTEEFGILDILSYTKEICQRDLAKIILKDRANTGKILDTLEKKGYIERIITTKNNRLVKMAKLTKTGEDFLKLANDKFLDTRKIVDDGISPEDREKVIKSLQKLREFLKDNIETQI